MIPVLDSTAYLERLLAAPRPGGDKVLVHYDHRVGAFCKDPRLMLLPLDDHLVHRGDGVFETVKWEEGYLYQLDAHIARMGRSAKAVFLTPPCSWDVVRELCVEAARVSGAETGMLRILLGRGPGGFGIDPDESPVSSLYMVGYKYVQHDDAWFARGVTACRSSVEAKQSFMANIKSTNYLPNVLMKREAKAKGCDYPLCFDGDGFLAESATENICLIDQRGSMIIPEFTHSLPGTTITRVLDLIKDEISVVFRPVREEEILEAREAIMLGTSFDVVGVVRYNGKPIHDVRPGPVAARLRELLIKDRRENGVRV